jgi:hypothetical protein
MCTRIETQKISARLDISQVTCANRLGKNLDVTSDFAPLFSEAYVATCSRLAHMFVSSSLLQRCAVEGRRLRETLESITMSCRLGLEAVAAAVLGMHPLCMSSKPRLDWLVMQPVRLHRNAT